jgi:P27 family predicted phage terminase small subunit
VASGRAALSLFGLLHTFDVMLLAAYCTSYQHWRMAEELLARMAAGDAQMHGLLVRGSKGQPVANPLIEISRMAARDMVRFADEFGFSPAARSRISAGISLVPEPPSKFDGLIGRPTDRDRLEPHATGLACCEALTETSRSRGDRSVTSDDGFEIITVQAEAAKRGRASIWTVYGRPRDYPTGFVAKMFELSAAGAQPPQYAI